jgi:hypothetical protein
MHHRGPCFVYNSRSIIKRYGLVMINLKFNLTFKTYPLFL